MFATPDGAARADRGRVRAAWEWATRSAPDVVLATFPLSLAITPAAALEDAESGGVYRELLETGKGWGVGALCWLGTRFFVWRPMRARPVLAGVPRARAPAPGPHPPPPPPNPRPTCCSGVADERALVMLFLTVERAKGGTSFWAPWLDALPRTFSTPLYFSDAHMRLLAGTNLARATSALRRRLDAAWVGLAPGAAAAAAAAGVAKAPPRNDFKWAYSIFWRAAWVGC